ncbi:Uncharacterized protein APZ42_007253 [Daphnia magna]|uniref:Uncharacterized protein n=1 Tax=Daphnia magna TaxID=35525 RepID=A0A164FEJ3_9CRUS|nr:Uncharacterized protein APZ42_007253 [Daphnia magna]
MVYRLSETLNLIIAMFGSFTLCLGMWEISPFVEVTISSFWMLHTCHHSSRSSY